MLSILDARLRIQGGDKSVGAGPSLTHVPFMRENMCAILCEMEANISPAQIHMILLAGSIRPSGSIARREV